MKYSMNKNNKTESPCHFLTEFHEKTLLFVIYYAYLHKETAEQGTA